MARLIAIVGELLEAEIERVLVSAWRAHLGIHAGGRTYVVPISFAYDGKRLVGQTRDGLKIRMMRENPEVCVQCDEVENLGN